MSKKVSMKIIFSVFLLLMFPFNAWCEAPRTEVNDGMEYETDYGRMARYLEKDTAELSPTEKNEAYDAIHRRLLQFIATSPASMTIAEKQQELQMVRNYLKEQLAINENNPSLWYLLAEDSFGFMYAYFDSNTPQPDSAKPLIEKHRKNAIEEYTKAFSLDKEKGSHLTCSMRSNVVGTLDNTDDQLLVVKRFIDECSPGSRGAERARMFGYYTGVLTDKGRWDEAQEAIEAYDKEFPDYQIKEQFIQKKAEYDAAMRTQADLYAEVDKTEPVAEPYAASEAFAEPVEKAPALKQESVAEPEQKSPLPGLVFVGGIIGLLLYVWYVIRRKRK